MSLVLTIDSTANPYGVAFGKNKEIIFDSTQHFSTTESRDISFLVTKGLESIGETVDAIQKIGINRGPGGTNSVRTGVSFANGLSYSLGIPVCAFNSFELMGYPLWKKMQCPIICTKKAMKGNAYVGLYQNNSLQLMRFGLLEELIQEITAGIQEFATAGAHNDIIPDLFPSKKIHHTGINNSRAVTILELDRLYLETGVVYPNFVHPINEQSPIVHGKI